MTAPVLRASALVKRFGSRTAVDGVSFEVAAGECYGLLGPNGAGKTTTISIACGLVAADGGEVVVDGRPMTPAAVDAKAAIGLVPQDVALYPDLTARENLRLFGKLYGLRGAALDGRIGEVLDIVGLADRAGDKVATYSGGMMRRANIAAGLLHRPKLLVLDEPTVGVDPQSRNAILDAVAALRAEGLAVLYTTHYMEEAERLCDRIGIIDEGMLVGEGTRAELVDRFHDGVQVRVTAEADTETLAGRLRALPVVAEAAAADGSVVVHATGAAGDAVAAVVAEVAAAGYRLTGVEVVEPDLEAVFLRLTGKALRD